MMNLRPYQHEARDAIHDSDSLRQLIVMPTGTGKTVLFAQLTIDRMPKGRVLILVHRDELVRQTVGKLKASGIEAKSIGIMKAEQSQPALPIVVASVQTISRPNRALQFTRYGKAATLIIDEAHHAPAPSYRDVIDWCLEAQGLLVGLTATPDRDMKGSAKRRRKNEQQHTFSATMGTVFDSLTYYRSLGDMISEGWLTDLVPATVKTNLDLSTVKETAGDWQAGQLGSHMVSSHATINIVDAWAQVAQDRPTLAFMPTVESSIALADQFEAKGFRVAHIDANTEWELRQLYYKQLANGDLQVVCNCMVLTEGFDEPSISCVIVGRPTKSRALFTQMIGRGTRLSPNKENCLVMSVIDHDLDLSPVKLQDLFNDLEWKDGQSLSERQEEIVKAKSKSREQAEIAFDFVQAFKARSSAKLNWRKMGNTWKLSLGKDGYLTLLSVGKREFDGAEMWQMVLPDGETFPPNTIDGAVADAEHFVSQSSHLQTLNNPDAAWRELLPTDKQIELARRKGIDIQGKSRGEVSDLLSDKLLEPATDAQIKYMRRLGYKENVEMLTKTQARKWIADHVR